MSAQDVAAMRAVVVCRTCRADDGYHDQWCPGLTCRECGEPVRQQGFPDQRGEFALVHYGRADHPVDY